MRGSILLDRRSNLKSAPNLRRVSMLDALIIQKTRLDTIGTELNSDFQTLTILEVGHAPIKYHFKIVKRQVPSFNRKQYHRRLINWVDCLTIPRLKDEQKTKPKPKFTYISSVTVGEIAKGET